MRIACLVGVNPDGKSEALFSGLPNEVREEMKKIRLGKKKIKFEEVRYFEQHYQKVNVKNALATIERREKATPKKAKQSGKDRDKE